jgi:hypothetical protein
MPGGERVGRRAGGRMRLVRGKADERAEGWESWQIGAQKWLDGVSPSGCGVCGKGRGAVLVDGVDGA